jgi:hypothetical protein
MANFTPMGGIPEGYDSLMNSARQQLVQLPDGRLVPAPQFGGQTSLDAIYGGIIPPSGGQPQSGQLTANGLGLAGWNQGGGEAGMQGIPSPQGSMVAAGGSGQNGQFGMVDPRMRGQMTAQAAPNMVGQPRGSVMMNKDMSRLDPGTALAFAGEQSQPPAIAAINQAVMPPMPRTRPQPPQPPAQITVRGGNTEGDYTVKRGDTLWNISQRTGIPVAVIARDNGISDPNRLAEGQKLNLSSSARAPANAPFPMQRPPSMSMPRAGISPPMLSQADPWAGMRIGPPPAGRPGMITATPQSSSQSSSSGTTASNPTKYGATSQERQAAAQQRATFLESWGR